MKNIYFQEMLYDSLTANELVGGICFSTKENHSNITKRNYNQCGVVVSLNFMNRWRLC